MSGFRAPLRADPATLNLRVRPAGRQFSHFRKKRNTVKTKLHILKNWEELKQWLEVGVNQFNQTIKESDAILTYGASELFIEISRAGSPFDRTEIMLEEKEQFLIHRQSAHDPTMCLTNDHEVVTFDDRLTLTFRDREYRCCELADAILKLATGQPAPTPRRFTAASSSCLVAPIPAPR